MHTDPVEGDHRWTLSEEKRDKLSRDYAAGII